LPEHTIKKAQSSLIKRETPLEGLSGQKITTKETRLETMISDKVFDQIKNIEIMKEAVD
jgi:hypothetical protein